MADQDPFASIAAPVQQDPFASIATPLSAPKPAAAPLPNAGPVTLNQARGSGAAPPVTMFQKRGGVPPTPPTNGPLGDQIPEPTPYGTNQEQAIRAAKSTGAALSAVAPVMTFGASLPVQAAVSAGAGALGTKSEGGTNLQALRNAVIGGAIPPLAEYGGRALGALKGAAKEAFGGLPGEPSLAPAHVENPVAQDLYSPEGQAYTASMRSNSHFDMPAEASRAIPALQESAADLGVKPSDFEGMNGPAIVKRINAHAIDINEARNVALIDPVRSLPADTSTTPELSELLGKKNPTVGDVDAFRLEANKKLAKSGYYGQSPSQQYAAGPDLAKLETAASQARDTVYDSVLQHTGVDIRPSKQIEASLIKMNDVANSTNNTLAQQEAKYQSTPMKDKILGSVKRLVSIKANPTNAFEAGISSPTDEYNANMKKVFGGTNPQPGSVMKNEKLVEQTKGVLTPPPGQMPPEPNRQLPLNLEPGQHGFNLTPPHGQTPPAPASQYGLPGISRNNLDLPAPPQPTLTPPGPTQLPASPLENMKRLAAAPGEGRTTMSATEFTDALKNNRSMRTPFDYTEGARQTANDLGSEAAQRGRAAEIAKKYPVQSINPIRDPFAAPARTAEAPVSHNMITDAEGKPDRLEIMKGDQPLGHLKIEEQIPGTWTVKDATVNQPGKGYGSGAYKQLISEAQKAGIKTIESDISNTSNASGVWKSLQREFPKAVTEENGQYSMDVTRLKK